MHTRLKIFLSIGIVLIIALTTLVVMHDFSSPDTYSSISGTAPLQILSSATSTNISTSSRAALLSSTTGSLNAPKEPTIVPVSSPTGTPVTPPLDAQGTLPPSAPSTTVITNTPPQITVDPQSIVGILCYYNDTYTNKNTGQTVYAADDEEVRGSGVIINSKGDILTNRHIIQQPETQTTINDQNGNPIPISVSYQLDHCDVGQLPGGATLPTVSQIQSINPYIQIPVLGYTAQPIFISPTAGLSSLEVQYADFAILGITGVSASGPTFNINSVPSSFPYATLLPIEYHPDILNSQVVTYGFPGDITSGQGNFFQTLTMTGSVGTVTSVNDGDQFYSETPLIINTNLAIAHGRSGSPLFWRGYVVGIITFFTSGNDTESGSVASDAILKGLLNTNYIAASQ